jgi:cell wall-associated NlpC family hydrolase
VTFAQRAGVLALVAAAAVAANSPEGRAALTGDRPGGHAPAASAMGVRAGHAAERQLGKPYGWASNGPRSFDCSGLVIFGGWDAAGAHWPDANANTLGHHFPRVSARAARPGDLLVWDWQGDGRYDHVAIVTTGGRFVEAPQPGVRIRVRKLAGAGPTAVVRPRKEW